MEKIYQHLDAQQIKDQLMAHSYGTETLVYQKPLSEEELMRLEKDFIQSAVKFGKLTDDFNKMKEEFKNKMKPVEQVQKEQLKVLKTKTKETEGVLFMMDDQENRVMRYYDETGTLIMQRPLLQSERQLSLVREAM